MTAPAHADANAVRIPAAELLTEKRTVIVHLTPYAPGCATAWVSDKQRNRTFWDRPAGGIVRAVMTKLNRVPSSVRVETDAAGDPVMVGDVSPFGEVPLAYFWAGLTAPEILDVLGELGRRGWAAPSAPAPIRKPPPPQVRSLDSLMSFDERFRA